ncbi:hypothetical protein HYPSUDRAFT_47952 [Hypholoma sublateritium FD-334 SS-4]|uniref:Uncharacterized protein n=1 Tax=Hypholoma sublateritium (strain FD-334 SS-4) TaxID=945553 RepID=A0A0D2LYD9_HYPSF|nr:hypothetical protein HYPSUDRAFT_47952 [Hypholoma sublateritium FD-334 SS-4]
MQLCRLTAAWPVRSVCFAAACGIHPNFLSAFNSEARIQPLRDILWDNAMSAFCAAIIPWTTCEIIELLFHFCAMAMRMSVLLPRNRYRKSMPRPLPSRGVASVSEMELRTTSLATNV